MSKQQLLEPYFCPRINQKTVSSIISTYRDYEDLKKAKTFHSCKIKFCADYKDNCSKRQTRCGVIKDGNFLKGCGVGLFFNFEKSNIVKLIKIYN